MTKIDDCVICLDSLNDNVENLPCNHKLHLNCIKKLVTSKCPSKYKCPICRYPLKCKDEDEDEDEDINNDTIIRPSSPTSSPNPTFLLEYEEDSQPSQPSQQYIPLPIIQAMMFSLPVYPVY